MSDAPAARLWVRRHPLLTAYLVLVLASTVVRWTLPDARPRADQVTQELATVAEDRVVGGTVTMAYYDRPAASRDAPVVLLLHGSPLASPAMFGLANALGDRYRLLIPDLPGLRGSTIRVPDYSVAAHGRYVTQLLDSLGIAQAHAVAYSMSGGVVLHAADIAPGKIASNTMLAAIGVQEMELLGDYHLNHAVHGLQLGALWLIQTGVPHFGYMDDAVLSVSYARNFYDTDQRPLRAILEGYAGPMQILHSRSDGLVPFAAAEEHYRLVPQSTLIEMDDGHSIPFTEAEAAAAHIAAFIDQVEAGNGTARSNAAPDRLVAATQPFDEATVPRPEGVTLGIFFILIALVTLISEDLACIGAGLLIARGTLTFTTGTLAAFTGIFVGDILLFLAGRYLGRPFLGRAPLKWFVSKQAVERGTAWLQERGAQVIIISRFIPGTRFATYFGAGMLHTSFWWFTLFFFVAVAIWTPALVGLSAWAGEAAWDLLARAEQYAWLVLVGFILGLLLLLKIVVPLFSYRGRRLLVSSWKRLTHWEFWPMWAIYPPVVVYGVWLSIKHRSATVFTLANPGMPDGGIVGESKAEILTQLRPAGDAIATFDVIEPDEEAERAEQVAAFLARHGFAYPVVLKPDVGERGQGVGIIRSDAERDAYLAEHPERLIAQEYVPGLEYGVFYYRHPGEAQGHLFAITDKRFPTVNGDGQRTLERLILDDPRAVCMARFLLNHHADRLRDVPADGEVIRLVELGTHSRGSLFLDGTHLATPDLLAEIDLISQVYDGFYFGRYDLRVPSVEDFQAGRHLKIVELNGLTSEATSMYDPQHSVFFAWRTLMTQWRIAFEIGAANRTRGMQAPGVWGLLGRLVNRG
ncbi:MAG: alpha/beta fold hydrolase [Bacteroidota bacterium]